MWWKWQILMAVAVHAMTGGEAVDTENENGITCEEYVITGDELGLGHQLWNRSSYGTLSSAHF